MQKKVKTMIALAFAALIFGGAHAAGQGKNSIRYYEGAINNKIKIVMKLERNGRELSGVYFYEKVGAAIALKGAIIDQQNVVIDELDDEENRTAVFKGKLTSDKTIEGVWAKASGQNSMPFYLKEIDTAAAEASAKAEAGFEGDWRWERGGYTFDLSLKQSGNKLSGDYCAVTKNATRVDCDSEIKGTIESRSARVKFTSGYSGADGTATIIRHGDFLIWGVDQMPDGDFFAPRDAMLRKPPQKK